MKISGEYTCKDCGYKFTHIPIISNIIRRWMILEDPAPTYSSFFRLPLCPKCGSKNIKKGV